MNFQDVELFIREKYREICYLRRRSTLFRLLANITVLAVAIILSVGALQYMAIGLNSLGAHRQAETMWLFFGEKLGLLWIFVLALPFPKAVLAPGNEFQYFTCLAFCAGIFFVCAVLKNHGITLRKIADKAEETLNLQAPLLRAIAATARQAATIGKVTGDSNTVNATNTVTHILHEGEKQSVTNKLLIGIVVSVGAAIVNHFLHLT